MAGKRRFGRVRKLPSGRYQARYRGPDGRDHPAPVTFAGRREAERFLTVVESDVVTGRWRSPAENRLTVRQWAETWFASASGTWKPKTRHTYRSVLDRMVYPALGDRTLSTLRPMDMSRWTAELADRVSPSQVRQAYRLISQIMKSAVENDILGQSRCRGVRLPRLPESDPKILTVEQVAALAEQCAPPDRVLVLLLAYGGLRIGEALALRRRSVDVPAGRLMIAEAVAQIPGGSVIDTPKNHQRRELVVPRFVAALLQEHLATVDEDPEAFLFPGRQGHTISRQQSYYGFRSRFIVAAMAAGLVDITPHDLRATHASWVADSHGILVAARRLGHSSSSVTTRHYARPINERDAEVAQHFDDLHADRVRGSGTQRARKIEKHS